MAVKQRMSQGEVLKALESFIDENDYVPSIRELAKITGLKSPASVQYHLKKLEELGHISRSPKKSRTLKLKNKAPGAGRNSSDRNFSNIPLVGDVAAGTGVIAAEYIEEFMAVPPELTTSGELFILKVRGDSMKDLGIFEGDWVVVRSQPRAENGDIVVAAINDEEATVKEFRRDGAAVKLIPANDSYETISIPAKECTIFGKVISVMRRL